MSEPASKKAKLDAGDIPGNCYEISEEAKKSLVEIDKVQGDIDKLNEKASDEILLVRFYLVIFMIEIKSVMFNILVAYLHWLRRWC